MSNMLEYAKKELERIPNDEDGIQAAINKDILEIVETFSKQGHSEFTASYTIGILDRLLRCKPLTPLTGEDDEWEMVPSFPEDVLTMYQNKRCSSVFKYVYQDGRTECIDAEHNAVSNDGGISFFTAKDFYEKVTFPYYPPTHQKEIYIEYTNEDENKYVVITGDNERIEKMREKYEKNIRRRKVNRQAVHMIQTNIFDDMYPNFKITKPLRLIELFAGIGTQAKALERLGADFEHYRICEFDKYAVQSYNAVHGTNFETSDIRRLNGDDLGIVDTDKYEYMLTYSYPCTSLSIAGKMEGMAKGSGTESSLLWEVERLLNETDELPQILVMENVPQVLGQKNIGVFKEWITFLESKGYQNYVDILNAKDYGIPQNRKRCFMVSLLGQYSYQFPEKIKLTRAMGDYLEPNEEVDEKYYLSTKMIEFLVRHNKETIEANNGFVWNPKALDDIANTITAGPQFRATDNSIMLEVAGNLEMFKNYESSSRVYYSGGLSPTLNTAQGGGQTC